MSDLNSSEKRKLERLLGMSTGYVINFSDRTFSEFVEEHTGRDINDESYNDKGTSKANRLRSFWKLESNHVIGRLITALIDYGEEIDWFRDNAPLALDCRSIGIRLTQGSLVPEMDALSATVDERDFEAIASQVREAIEKNQPETGLDRLHTFVIKYVRVLCDRHGITHSRDKALHSVFGEYVRLLHDKGLLESEMTTRILKSSISVLESFNHVRNNQSLAHDNPILNYDESLLIFNHVAASIRFLRALDAKHALGNDYK
jgi:hypothetical protein